MPAPFLSRIRIYPIKSLDPVEMQEAEVGVSSLLHDREFALLARDGHFINGKRTGRVSELKAEYDLPNQIVRLSPRDGSPIHSFHLLEDQKKIEIYLSDFFKEPVLWVRNNDGELMDIPHEASVTIVSEASFQSLHQGLSIGTMDNLRLRFRATLEISGTEPFWEESMINEKESATRLTIGEVELMAMSPRARCNVPPRDPLTGISDKSFVKRMMKSRADSLPANSVIPAYGNLYYLAINTLIPRSETGKWLRVGDLVRILI